MHTSVYQPSVYTASRLTRVDVRRFSNAGIAPLVCRRQQAMRVSRWFTRAHCWRGGSDNEKEARSWFSGQKQRSRFSPLLGWNPSSTLLLKVFQPPSFSTTGSVVEGPFLPQKRVYKVQSGFTKKAKSRIQSGPRRAHRELYHKNGTVDT